MASVNKVLIIGNLGRDPEMRYLPSGEAVANLAVACTDKYKDKSGQVVEVTEWVRVAFFGRTAEVCGQYLKKGAQVYVEGSLRTRKFIDKEGVTRYVTEIRGDRMQMLGNAPTAQRDPRRPYEENPQPAGDYASASGGSPQPFDDGDIPF